MLSPLSSARIDNEKRASEWEAGILKPHNHDVLSGRGNFVNNHEGNKRFRALVNEHKQSCVACPKSEKSKYAELIVNELRNLNPPGRFLKKDDGTRLWYDIGKKKTFDKTRQALREGAPTIRQNVGGNKSIENPSVVISTTLSNSNERSIYVTRPIPSGLVTSCGEAFSPTTKPNADDFQVDVEYDSGGNAIRTDHPDAREYFLENTKKYLSSIVLSDHKASMGNISTDLNAPESIVFEQSTRNFIYPSRERFYSDATFSISDFKRNWSDSDLGRLEEKNLLSSTLLEDRIPEREHSSLKSNSTTSSRRNMFTGSIGSNKSENLMIDDSNQTLQSYTRGASSFLDMMSLEDMNDNPTPHQFIFRFKSSKNDDDNYKKLANRPRSQSLGDISTSSSFMRNGPSGSNVLFSFSANMDDTDNE